MESQERKKKEIKLNVFIRKLKFLIKLMFNLLILFNSINLYYFLIFLSRQIHKTRYSQVVCTLHTLQCRRNVSV